MAFDMANAPLGFYTAVQVHNIAATHFPGAYNAIIPVQQLCWVPVVLPSIYNCGLFVGYLVEGGTVHQVFATMQVADRTVRFSTFSGLWLNRTGIGKVQLVAPFVHLAENNARPQLFNLQTMCQLYFALGGISGGVVVSKKTWFRAVEMSCHWVGQGMGTLPRVVPQVAEIEDGGYDGGDEGEQAASGMQVKKSARIVQRLVAMSKKVNPHWTKHVEAELKAAWPGMRKHWKK